jgi:hypothetical protein
MLNVPVDDVRAANGGTIILLPTCMVVYLKSLKVQGRLHPCEGMGLFVSLLVQIV